MPKRSIPRWQQAPAMEEQGPSSTIDSPMPGFDAFDPSEAERPLWQQAPEVRDDTHSTFVENPPMGVVSQFGRSANVGIAEGLGGFADFSNFLLSQVGLGSDEPVGGSKSLQRLFSFLDIAPTPEEPDPDTLAGSAGRLTGLGATLLIPFGAATQRAAQISRNLRPPPKTVAGRVMHQMAETALRGPKRFIAGEVAAGVTAGAGGFVARELFPDSEAASLIGELLGGVTPATAVGTAKKTLTVVGAKLARRMFATVTARGGQGRARDRFEAVARDPKEAARELEAGGALEGADLTPAQQTGDEGLLSLEKSVIESSEKLKAQADQQIAQATATIRAALSDLGKGVPVKQTAETLKLAREHLTALLDTRMKIAARRADELIAELAPGASRQDANLIAKEAIEEAEKAAEDQIDELFAAVPLEVVVTVKPLKDFLTALITKTPLAQREDIPTVAARLLGKDETAPEGFEDAFAAFDLSPAAAGRFADEVAVAELQGLRSKLLEEARIARSAGQSNKARLANEIADEVLDAMGATRDDVKGPAGAQLRLALDFVKDTKERFNTGAVRNLLRPTRQGGDVVPGALTLETTVGRGGPRGRVETAELQKAVERTGDVPKLRGAVEDFLLDDFNRRVIRNGKIDPTKAETFLARHQDVLEDFPELAARLDDAIDANDLSRLTREKAEGVARRLDDPKVSRAAIFLKEPVEDGIQRIAKLPESEAGAAMQEVIKQAQRDPTGDALKGLKTAFGDFLLNRTSSTITTKAGEFTIHGTALERLLKSGPSARMAKELFDAGELERLDQIVKTAVKLEKALKVKGRPEGVIADAPSKALNMLAGILGAFVGRKLGTGTIQAPGFVANLFRSQLLKRTQDPARRLILDAMQDQALFDALLHDMSDIPQVARRQLNAWALAVAKDSLEPSEEAPAAPGEPEAPIEGSEGIAPLGGTGEAVSPQLSTGELEADEVGKALRAEEGDVLTVFTDTTGNLTVGVGHKVLSKDKLKLGDTITEERKEKLLQQDREKAEQGAGKLISKLGQQPSGVKVVLTQMVFQLGLAGVRGFKDFLAALDQQDYQTAADEMLDSKWAREDSPDRAQRLADQIRALDTGPAS